MHKIKREYEIIDVACPGDSRVESKEDEEIEKHRDLAIEINCGN